MTQGQIIVLAIFGIFSLIAFVVLFLSKDEEQKYVSSVGQFFISILLIILVASVTNEANDELILNQKLN